MYKNNLVVAIKANSKILREFKDVTYIPFGVEYSILLKNLNSVRAIVNVYIDGTDITPGGLVINANQEVDLERSLANGNLNVGNKLKFIEKTAKIEQHRGSKVDDGFIRVEFQYEKVYTTNAWDSYYTTPTILTNHIAGNHTPYQGVTRGIATGGMCASGSIGTTTLGGIATNAVYTAQTATANATHQEMTLSASNATFNDAGITVAGSKSEQKFTTASWFPVEQTKHVITMKLLGENPEGKKIEAPITVKAKPRCETCGRNNKATAKFCSECGTSLTIF